MNVRLRQLLLLGLAVAFVWGAKLLVYSIEGLRALSNFALPLAGLGLNLMALWLLSIALGLSQATSRRVNPLRIAFIGACVFTAFQLVALIPDTYLGYAAAESGLAFPLLILTFIVFTALLAVARMPAFMLIEKTTHMEARPKSLALIASLALLHVCEFGLLFVLPSTYMAAFVSPLPLPTETLSRAPARENLSAIVDTQLSIENKRVLSRGQGFAFSMYGQKVGQKLAQDIPLQNTKRLAVFLPENTFTTVRLEDLQAFYDSLASEVSAAAQVSQLDLFIGVEFDETSSIARLSNATSNPALVRVKDEFMPFFEKPVMGIYLSRGKIVAKTSASPEAQEFAVPGFSSPLTQNNFLVCYEALNPLRWQWHTPRVVFANHVLLNGWGLMGRMYSLTLLTLASIYQSPVLLVANEGLSGLFGAHSDLSSSVHVLKLNE